MSIRPALLKELARKHVLTLTGNQTIANVVSALKADGSSENETFAVVQMNEQQYAVATMVDLAAIIQKLGPAGFAQPLYDLPLPLAHQVISVDTKLTSADVKREVGNNPGRPFVIVDNTGFVALLLNVNLSGLDISTGSLLQLHGELVAKDERVKVQPTAPKPVCPHCANQDYYKYQSGSYRCRSCGKVVAP